MADEAHRRRSDALAMGLFGVAVGSLTLGLAKLGAIPDRNHVETLVLALACGGLGPFLAGIATIRNHEPLCGAALATYGGLWITVCTANLVSSSLFMFPSAFAGGDQPQQPEPESESEPQQLPVDPRVLACRSTPLVMT